MFCRLRERTPRILLDSDGFSVAEDSIVVQRVEWVSVEEIFAFKVDLLTYDTIRLGFRLSNEGNFREVDEEWQGFPELLAEIHRRFEIIDPDWWSHVAFPAFATNLTTLWKEPAREM